MTTRADQVPTLPTHRHEWRAGSRRSALKAVILGLLLFLLLRAVPMGEVASSAGAFPTAALAGIVCLSVPWFLLRLLKWSLLLRAFSIPLGLWDRMGSLSLGVVAGSFTPLQAGEMARVVPTTAGTRIVVGTMVLVDKVIDLLTLLMLAAAGVLMGWRNMAVATVVAAAYVSIPRRRVRQIIGSRWEDARKGLRDIRPIASMPLLVAASFVATALAYAIVLAQYHVALRALAPEHDPRVLAVCPLIMLARAIPLTFAGLGAREGLAAAMFPRFGVPPAAAVVVSLLLFVANLGVPLLGATAWLVRKHLSIRDRRRDDRTGDYGCRTGKGHGTESPRE